MIVSLLTQNDNVLEFLVKRATRILPLAYLYAVIVFTFIRFEPPTVFWTASLVENYFTSHLNVFNSHFWSLCVEFQFYIVIAFVVFIAGAKGLWVVWPACVAITAIRISEGAYINILTHLRVDEILAGGCVAMIYQRFRFDEHRFLNVAVWLAALLWFVSSSPFSGWVQYLRPYASAALLAAVLCHRKTLLAALLSSRPMQYLATISFALYVIHHATYQEWFDQGTTFERYILKRPISFALTFGLAHLSTFYWERPWLDAGKKWISERRMRQNVTTDADFDMIEPRADNSVVRVATTK